jgi:hypothetical protein
MIDKQKHICINSMKKKKKKKKKKKRGVRGERPRQCERSRR